MKEKQNLKNVCMKEKDEINQNDIENLIFSRNAVQKYQRTCY